MSIADDVDDDAIQVWDHPEFDVLVRNDEGHEIARIAGPRPWIENADESSIRNSRE